MPIESLGIGGWLRSLAFAAIAIAGADRGRGGARRRAQPAGVCIELIGATAQRTSDPLALVLGLLLVALTALALQSALALSFDPRYRDFPFAPMTGALCHLSCSALASARVRTGQRGRWRKAGRGRDARALRDLHRLERDIRQLAGAVVCAQRSRAARRQSPADAGRARLRISTATAKRDSADVVEHDAARRRRAARSRTERATAAAVEHRGAQRDDPEHLRLEQRNRRAAAGAEQRSRAGFAGDADRGIARSGRSAHKSRRRAQPAPCGEAGRLAAGSGGTAAGSCRHYA